MLSRRAVADRDAMLREGDLVIQRAFPGDGTGRWPDTLGDLRALGPEGGKVSLPDGSVVEVEATTWRRLVRDLLAVGWADEAFARSFTEADYPAILDAWNEKHGIEAQDERGSR